MLNLKNYSIPNNDSINNLNKKLLSILNNDNFFNFDNVTQIPNTGYHFENLDPIMNNQIKDALKLYTSNNTVNYYYHFYYI